MAMSFSRLRGLVAAFAVAGIAYVDVAGAQTGPVCAPNTKLFWQGGSINFAAANTALCDHVVILPGHINLQVYNSPSAWQARVTAECDGSRHGNEINWHPPFRYCGPSGPMSGGYGPNDACLDATFNDDRFVSYGAAGLLYHCEGEPQEPPPEPQTNSCLPQVGGGDMDGRGTIRGVGHPVLPDAGTKIFAEVDYSAPGSSLTIARRYNSRGLPAPIGTAPALLGDYWRTAYDRSVHAYSFAGSTAAAIAVRSDFRVKYFDASGTELFHFQGTPAEKLVSNGPAGWTYTAANDDTETYNSAGRLTSILDRNKQLTSLSYDPGTGRLSTVTDSRGRTLTYTYSADFNGYGVGWVSIATNDGSTVRYDMEASNLRLVTRSDGATRQYLYENLLKHLVTGVIDEKSVRYETIDYYADGRAQASYLAPAIDSGSIGRHTFTYNTNGTTTVVNPLGASSTLSFDIKNGVRNLAGVTQPCSSCGLDTQTLAYDNAGYLTSKTDFKNSVTTYVYDHTRGLELERTEASNDSASPSSKRRTVTEWETTLRQPRSRTVYNALNIAESKTRWKYSTTTGQQTARCDIDLGVANADSYDCGLQINAPAGVRQSTTSYCDTALPNSTVCPLAGLVKSVNGPRLTTDAGLGGVDDVSTYAYYASTDESGCATLGGACHRIGDLWKVTNALGQVVSEIVSYDKNGRVKRTKDVNGTVTDLTYTPRGWLETRIVRYFANGNPLLLADAKTTFAYDAVGNVTQVTQPDGAFLHYTYDAAHRLTDIQDNLSNLNDIQSNAIHYSLDAAGNRIGEQTRDPGGALKRALTRDYNNLSRLVAMRNAAGLLTRDSNLFDGAPLPNQGYDGNGNAVQFADGLGIDTQSEFDPLNRLVKTIQDFAGTIPETNYTTTEYHYDARDNLVKVTDPSALDTTYTYDGLNNLTALDSPDTGHTSYTYDRAGNRITQTDNRSPPVTSTYVYDALNRLTAITYADTTQNVSFAYDQSNAITGCASSFPLGRLTRMTDNSGSTTYCYDRRGNVLKKSQITNGLTLDVVYTYSTADRLATVTYPSGAIVTYGRDSVGRINNVSWKANAAATPVTVISAATYYPYGPLNMLTYGNGRTLTKTYDQDYAIDRVVSSAATGLLIDFTTNVMGNIVDASDTIGLVPPTRKYIYDRLYRLTDVDTGNTALEGFTYNDTGDRLSKQIGVQAPQVYTYLAGTHRLGSVAGITRDYDGNGNLVSNNTGLAHPTHTYDQRNRLSASQFNNATVASYVINGRGERVAKNNTVPVNDRLYAYNEAGQQIGDYPGSGKVNKGSETLYLDATPIATITSGVLSYLETDHLGTPRIAADPVTNAQQWKWDFFADAFGDNAATIAPSGGIDVKLRYPGQVFDAETGLHYNYFRDYEPSTGRYVESDPIGQFAGPSTYSYVSSTPLSWVDSLGLDVDINLFPRGSGAYRFAKLYASDPQECTIAGHGKPESLAGMDAEQLKLVIDTYPQCSNKPIRLLACNTGVRASRGGPFGKDLAKATKQKVFAPTNWGWLHLNGTYTIGPANPQVDWWTPNAEEEAMKRKPACDCGYFREFNP